MKHKKKLSKTLEVAILVWGGDHQATLGKPWENHEKTSGKTYKRRTTTGKPLENRRKILRTP